MKKILVVEDEASIAKAFSELFANEGYETQKATEPLRVYDAVKEFQPDLIVLDLMMDYLDGYDQLRVLKLDAATSQIPIVVVTATPKPQLEPERSKYEALGVRAIFYKPPNVDELTAKVAELIGK